MTLDTEPYFDPESQEARTAGERVYLVEGAIAMPIGSEGVYFGRSKFGAFVGFDTPSGVPYKISVPFSAIRSLYR